MVAKRLLPLVPLAVSSTTALAQQAPQADDIVVTGSKMSRSLQDTFASVGVIGATDIEQSQVRDFADAFRLLANVRVGSSVDTGFVIRGINSQGIGVGAGALATLYIDNVPQTQQSSRRGANGLWDIEAIEVFRGPHSTISGRNSLAGAIYIRSREPGPDPETLFRAQLTDDDGMYLAAAQNVPLGERFALRVSGYFNFADDWHISYPAWIERVNYRRISTEKNYQLRGKLLYDAPGDRGLRALLTLSHAYFQIPRGTARGRGGIPALADRYGVRSVFDRVDYANSYLADFNNEARYGIADNAALEMVAPVSRAGGDLTLTAISTFINAKVFKPSINGRLVQDGNEIEREFSQEIRANYKSDNGRFDAVLGLYYLQGDETFFNDQPIRTATSIVGRRLLTGRIRTDSFAIFGEGTYEFVDRLSLILGGRWNREINRDWSQLRQWPYAGSILGFKLANFTGPPATATSTANRFAETVFLPKAGLAYRFTDDLSAAVTFQRGYRGGGTGINTTVNPPQRYFFDPEFTNNVELAVRSQWLDRRLTINANLFHTDWIDQQVPFRVVPTDPISSIVNAGRSRLKGFELDGRFQASPQLNLFANFGYIHTEFLRFVTPANIDFKGAWFPDAPRWNASGGFSWDHQSGLFLRADAQYTGKYFSSNLNVRQTDAVAAGDYIVANLNFGFSIDKLRITAFARNLFNSNVILFNGPLDDDVATFGRPRQLGLTLDFRL